MDWRDVARGMREVAMKRWGVVNRILLRIE